MTDAERFEAAVAGQVLGAAGAREELLQSIADVARAIFLAEAASIAVLETGSREFRFEAVAGQGADRLLGTTFPFGEGIAGMVAQTGEPAVVDDLSGDPRFARPLAEVSGYVPNAMMVAPLQRGEGTLGVLSVLDRGRTGRSTLQELELLVAFAAQAALAVDLGESARRAAELLRGGGEDVGRVAALAARVEALDKGRREAGLQLLDALDRLLR
jgi:signal transduction protein with GAF and PtsI domain